MMKSETKNNRYKSIINLLIKIKFDFDYGRNNGLNYVAFIIQLATLIEVLKINRIWYVILLPTAMILTWLWGYILRHINFRRREMDLYNEQNDIMIGLKNKLINSL